MPGAAKSRHLPPASAARHKNGDEGLATLTGFCKAVAVRTAISRLRSLASEPALVGARGLIVNGVIQVFPFERHAQSMFAAYVARQGLPVVNIGYGFGFAHGVLARELGRDVTLIEANSRLSRVAERAHGAGGGVINSAWQLALPALERREPFNIYFDAFPHFAPFDFSPAAFRRYLSEFFQTAVMLGSLRSAYFVVLDKQLVRFSLPRGWSARRVLARTVPVRAPSPEFSRISLYELRRVKAPLTQLNGTR